MAWAECQPSNVNPFRVRNISMYIHDTNQRTWLKGLKLVAFCPSILPSEMSSNARGPLDVVQGIYRDVCRIVGLARPDCRGELPVMEFYSAPQTRLVIPPALPWGGYCHK